MVEETASAFEMQHFQHPLEAYMPQDVMHGIIRRVVVPCNQRPKGFNPASIRHLTEVLTAWQHTAVTCCDFFQAFAWHVNVALQGRSSWKVQLFSIRFQVQLQNVTELQGSKIDQLGFIGFTLPNLPNTFACSILFHPVFILFHPVPSCSISDFSS